MKLIKKIMKTVLCIVTGIMTCLVLVLQGMLQPVLAENVKEEASTSDVFTKDAIQTFIDDYFQENMSIYKTPGVAVSVVKDSKELLTSSYGYADIESGKLVDETTTFPACSVSKLFTATAVMQLYEQGKMDLNADIRNYLNDVKIMNRFSEPITCASLLTHSSGLDEES